MGRYVYHVPSESCIAVCKSCQLKSSTVLSLQFFLNLFLFFLTLQKWCFTEANKRLSEIQGFLELSVQRSSCEFDCNKDRLYVYVKRHDAIPVSTSVIGTWFSVCWTAPAYASSLLLNLILIYSCNFCFCWFLVLTLVSYFSTFYNNYPVNIAGIHSFDFLGLGYRVHWPVTVVLTPDALKMYSEIFSFLIRVRLAVFSLTDTWRSLKVWILKYCFQLCFFFFLSI